MNALSVIESLLKNGKVPSMTIVFVTHGSGATRHEDYTCNPQYAKYIANDIVKWQVSYRRIISDIGWASAIKKLI